MRTEDLRWDDRCEMCEEKIPWKELNTINITGTGAERIVREICDECVEKLKKFVGGR